MAATREQVFQAINTEREYQNKRWCRTDPEKAAGHNPHTVTEWLVYMQHYVNEGLRIATVSNDPNASKQALEFARKVAALGVVCMEQHGAPVRQ